MTAWIVGILSVLAMVAAALFRRKPDRMEAAEKEVDKIFDKASEAIKNVTPVKEKYTREELRNALRVIRNRGTGK